MATRGDRLSALSDATLTPCPLPPANQRGRPHQHRLPPLAQPARGRPRRRLPRSQDRQQMGLPRRQRATHVLRTDGDVRTAHPRPDGPDPRPPPRLVAHWHPTITNLVQWILIALRCGAEELDLKLRCQEASRLRLCPFGEGCSADFNEGDIGRYVRTPAHLFRSDTLRHLSLSRWTLEFPADVSFVALETLVLHRIMGSGEVLQRLVSSCSQLTHLTLEECPGVTTITVASTRLRCFAMVCCHNARHLTLNSQHLHSLRYKGGLPPDRSFVWIDKYATVTALTIDICEDIDSKTPSQIAPFTELIGRCTNLEFLHLALRPAMACYSGLFRRVLRLLPRLRHLELKGCLHNEHSVASVSTLLQNTPNLQVLSLFPLLPDPSKKKKSYLYDFDDMDIEHNKDDDDDKEVCYGGYVRVPRGVWTTRVRCFNNKLRSISLADYRGRPFERMLVRFLLSKASALQEFSVSIAPKCSAHRDGIATELTNWRVNRHTRVTFV